MAILSRRRNRIYVFVAVIAGYVLCLATYPAFHSYLQERGALGNVVSDQLLKTSEEKNHKKYNNGGGGWTHNSDIHKEEKAKDERTNASDIYDISQNAALLDTDNLVANVVMYVWCGKRMFEFQHYLSVRSVLRNIRPDVIWFYKVHEPLVGKNSYNTWLSDIREGFPFFRSTSVSPVACVSSTGRPDASWVRKALRKHGGMYASENTIFVRPHIDLRKHAGFTTVDKNMDGFEIANGGRPGTAQQTLSFRAKMCIAEDAYGPNEVTALCVNRNGSSLHPDDIWQLDSAFGRLARLLAYGDAKFSVPTPHDKAVVPNIAHYVWLGNNHDIDYTFFLSILSVLYVGEVSTVFVHCDSRLTGPMWRRISARAKDRLRFVYRANAAGVYNQAITVRGHQADIVKADIMVKYGGILMDPDILMTRRLKDDLFRYETVVGLDFMPFPPFPDTLNMGICLCMPNAPFGRLWQQSQRNFNDSLWTWNSNQVTYKLLERHPRTAFIERHLQVICYMYHCHPTWLPRLVYQTVNTTYNTIQNLTNWKKDVFSVHFTYPDPFVRETVAATLRGLYGNIYKHVIQKANLAG